jgi:D-galactose 1-dehydrogenase
MAWRIGLIGLGKIARDQHLPVIAKNPNFKLAAVVSASSTWPGVPLFKTMDEMLASQIGLDAVSLSMPPGPRYGYALKALHHGLHVLMEKPPTPTVSELTELKRQAKALGRVLFTTWHSQYNRAVDEAKRLLSGKTVSRLHITWKEDVRHWHPGQAWIWQPGGFGVFDPAINAFSIVTKIMPKPVFVDSCSAEVPANAATPIAAQVRFRPSWEGRADLSADLDWRQIGEQTWDIAITTSDGLDLVLRRGGTELHVNGKLTCKEPSKEYEAIYRQFDELLSQSRSHVDAAPLQLVADCLMMARFVTVDEIT